MCLAIPGKVVSITGAVAEIDMDGTFTKADLSMVPKVKVGDYVIVHAGFVVQIYDEREALMTIELLRDIAEVSKTK